MLGLSAAAALPALPSVKAAAAPAPRNPRLVVSSGGSRPRTPVAPGRFMWSEAAVKAARTLAGRSAVLERPLVGRSEIVEQLRERLLDLLRVHGPLRLGRRLRLGRS